ncbi:hypothetical protein A0256_22580 [Mucilaginibacter sp. PAMC 26640]|nr:hypothetical protein A0256_22580 [Mucilaginibacter sp. PAMC 26640]
MLTLPLKTVKPHPLIAFGVVYFALAIWFIPAYFKWDANLVMGVILVPYVCTIEKGNRSLRYLLPALLGVGLAIIAPVNTLFFVALLFVVLLLIEHSIGRVSNIFLLLMLLISPVFGHITRMGEFPVRLWLTEKVANTLALTGMEVSAAGNQIMMGNFEFSVDQACAGLNMLVMSLLICLFVLTWYQRQSGNTLSFKYLWLLAAFTLLLNVVCNFFRILLLVRFKIMPGTFLHDAVGICCLAIYVLLPLLFGIKPLVHSLGKAGKQQARDNAVVTDSRFLLIHLFLLGMILFVAAHITKADHLAGASNPMQIAGYHKKQLGGGILKFENKEALIYLKPTAFYAPEHDPMICWVGSGYVFKSIRQENVAGYDIYTAILTKKQDKIYAAWWFDNGKVKTVNQFSWRWIAARNEGQFYLVNVNAASPEELHKKSVEMLTGDLFKKLNTK